MEKFDALVLSGGSTVPRDLNIPGRSLKGIHFAMSFLEQNNRRVRGDDLSDEIELLATGKNVVVIGGGDTGSDCVGTSNRHKATSVTQIELLSKPPDVRDESTPWPLWPMMLRTSSSHEEGCDRNWSILTKSFLGDNDGNLKGLEIVDITWEKDEATGRYTFKEIDGTLREIPCEMAFLAIGYLHPQHNGMLEQLGIDIDDRGNVKTTNYQTNIEKVFSAGDMRRGQSLVVWAISEGREAAREVDAYLMGSSLLEAKTSSTLEISG
jgi:glutamate synthase (NADPH/NADH) small chain